MERFKLGVCEWAMSTRGEELCRMASKSGLSCIQLGVGEEVFSGKGLGDTSLITEYMRACETYQIEVLSLAPQFVDQYSFTMPQSIQEEGIATALVEKTIELSRVFGCRSFLLPVLGKNGIVDGASFHRAAAYIRKFSNKAAEYGMETYLELNLGAEDVYNLLDAVDNPSVKLFFDSQNLYAHNGTAMHRYFTELADIIGAIHVKDGPGTLLSGSLLGEGTSGFLKTAGAILESTYSGPLIIESVYSKTPVCRLGSEEELLRKDAVLLRSVFGI